MVGGQEIPLSYPRAAFKHSEGLPPPQRAAGRHARRRVTSSVAAHHEIGDAPYFHLAEAFREAGCAGN